MIRGRRPGWTRLRVSVAGLGVLGMVIGGASMAWGCVPRANLVTLRPQSSGPPGDEVTVEGVGLDPGEVEVRWNAADGKLLGKGEGPDFTASIVIPEVAQGLYAVVVISRQPGGGIGSTGTAAFHVTMPVSPGGVDPAPSQGQVAPGSRTVARTSTSVASAARTALTLGAGAGWSPWVSSLVQCGAAGGVVGLMHEGSCHGYDVAYTENVVRRWLGKQGASSGEPGAVRAVGQTYP